MLFYLLNKIGWNLPVCTSLPHEFLEELFLGSSEENLGQTHFKVRSILVETSQDCLAEIALIHRLQFFLVVIEDRWPIPSKNSLVLHTGWIAAFNDFDSLNQSSTPQLVSNVLVMEDAGLFLEIGFDATDEVWLRFVEIFHEISKLFAENVSQCPLLTLFPFQLDQEFRNNWAGGATEQCHAILMHAISVLNHKFLRVVTNRHCVVLNLEAVNVLFLFALFLCPWICVHFLQVRMIRVLLEK
mmetsp:Transcript_19968/g.40346  ORF Transcript_19968/g.40346 Transcript_19968/m.40346 type:complete len:242 (-) Transcript_19968:1949-2674(-)